MKHLHRPVDGGDVTPLPKISHTRAWGICDRASDACHVWSPDGTRGSSGPIVPEPIWRRDGKELFYLAANRQLMAVPITNGSKFNAGEPKAMFETHVGPINPPFRDQYAANADGSRFLVNTVSEGSSSSPITVVLNWTEALKRRSD